METYVGILSDPSNAVWEIVTIDNLKEFVSQARDKKSSDGKKSLIMRLIYYEKFPNPVQAQEKEQEIKNKSRKAKLEFISEHNPGWKDLYEELA